jgi:hypothetical protein
MGEVEGRKGFAGGNVGGQITEFQFLRLKAGALAAEHQGRRARPGP